MKKLLLLVVGAVGVASAQESSVSRVSRCRRQGRKFSGTVLVARTGQVVIEQAYGMANRKANSLNTDDTLYRIGSMSKPITATAVMALRDAGKLKLDNSVCMYVDCSRMKTYSSPC